MLIFFIGSWKKMVRFFWSHLSMKLWSPAWILWERQTFRLLPLYFSTDRHTCFDSWVQQEPGAGKIHPRPVRQFSCTTCSFTNRPLEGAIYSIFFSFLAVPLSTKRASNEWMSNDESFILLYSLISYFIQWVKWVKFSPLSGEICKKILQGQIWLTKKPKLAKFGQQNLTGLKAKCRKYSSHFLLINQWLINE